MFLEKVIFSFLVWRSQAETGKYCQSSAPSGVLAYIRQQRGQISQERRHPENLAVAELHVLGNFKIKT